MCDKAAKTHQHDKANPKDAAPQSGAAPQRAEKQNSLTPKKSQEVDSEFVRAENEDDDGYDPYSDRRPISEPLFERDPWS